MRRRAAVWRAGVGRGGGAASLATLASVPRATIDRSARRPSRSAPSVFVVLAMVVWSCARDGARASPIFRGAPLVLISIDTLRSDRLPIYGYAPGATPAIDALRRDGVLSARAYTHAPLTLPAHVSILSGLLPPDHGVRDNLGYAVAPSLLLLPELLEDAGYSSGAAVSAAVLRRSSGIAAGFEVWDEPGGGAGFAAAEAERAGAETLRAILPWLRRVAASGGERFFLFFHLYEPHAPYRPPPSRRPLRFALRRRGGRRRRRGGCAPRRARRAGRLRSSAGGAPVGSRRRSRRSRRARARRVPLSRGAAGPAGAQAPGRATRRNDDRRAGAAHRRGADRARAARRRGAGGACRPLAPRSRPGGRPRGSSARIERPRRRDISTPRPSILAFTSDGASCAR